ncbi:DNA sulfur modification protein DndB [Sporosarcina obsidiansis]|uniref:DNA sulfur modification protein DndB n=1 Tax=Sporosarcina obsidiansis TaxID=2660748 RepID=UPI0018914066|nr:DNA sulfur modification protein DndB [Sporosarcina obsidiansis]
MLVNEVFSKKQTIVVYSVKELTEMLADERLVLRDINKGQVLMIRRYIVDNIEEEQIYLPPIVARIESGSLDDGKPDKLIIIDGTQRVKALTQLEAATSRLINSEDPKEQKRGFTLHYMLHDIQVAVQIFEGLTTSEADQLYIDLNTKGKKVSLSKRIAYDSRNEINQLTNKVLKHNRLLRKAGVEQEKIAVLRPKNKNLLSLSQLRRLTGYFMTGKPVTGKLNMSSENIVHTEEVFDLINSWFDELFELYPADKIGDYEESMLASFPLLSALAQYAYEGLEQETFETKREMIQHRMQRLAHIDWSRDQEIWRKFDGTIKGKAKYYYLHHDKKTNDALVSWLRLEGGE